MNPLIVIGFLLCSSGALFHSLLPSRLRGTTRELVLILSFNGTAVLLVAVGAVIELR